MRDESSLYHRRDIVLHSWYQSRKEPHSPPGYLLSLENYAFKAEKLKSYAYISLNAAAGLENLFHRHKYKLIGRFPYKRRAVVQFYFSFLLIPFFLQTLL